MTFEEIDKRFEKGEYKRPEKLDLDWKKKLPETYVFNEDLTVKENKEKLENTIKKFQNTIRKLIMIIIKMNKKFMKNYLMILD